MHVFNKARKKALCLLVPLASEVNTCRLNVIKGKVHNKGKVNNKVKVRNKGKVRAKYNEDVDAAHGKYNVD